MPFLPLPDQTALGTELPIDTADDLLAEYSHPHKTPVTATVRDAIVAGQTEGFLEYQDRSDVAAGQSDPLRATGIYLRGYAEEHEVTPRIGETDEELRPRIFATPSIVTPNAIESAVNEIIAPLTCNISELDLDGWFIHSDAPAVWDSFVGADPNYPDRYYDEYPSGQPGGAVPSNNLPRSFIIRIPSLTAQDDAFAYIGDSFFVANELINIYQNQQTSVDLYNAIIAIVQTIKGQGMSWSLVVDPRLN